MTETTWFWIGTIGMALGALVLGVVGKRRTQDEEGHTLIHAFVPLVAALAYLSMALQQGGVVLADGRQFWYARYLDWSVTTPLLLLALTMTALHGAHRRAGLVAALIGVDVIMIVTGLFFGASSDGLAKTIWYVVSCGAFLAVYAVLFGPLRREAAQRDDLRRRAFARNATLLAGLWLLYPIFVLLGPDGAAAWSPTLTTAAITLLDLAAKVGYGLLAAAGTKRITDHDLRIGSEPAPVETLPVPSGAGRGEPA